MQLYRIKNKTNVNRSISNFLLQPYKEITIDEKTFEFQRNGLERWADKGCISITTIKTLREVIQKEIPQVENEVIDLRANTTEEKKVDTKPEMSDVIKALNVEEKAKEKAKEPKPEKISEKKEAKTKPNTEIEKLTEEESKILSHEKHIVDKEDNIPEEATTIEEIIKLAKIGICAICQKHFKNEKGVWAHLRVKHQIKKNIPNDI